MKYSLTNFIRLLGTTRPPFLILTPIMIFLGVSVASQSTAINYHYLPWILTGGLMAHISVNTFNEYFDFKSGLDLITKRTPFSGGSGTLVSYPELAMPTLVLAVLSCLITLLIGCYLIWLTDWKLILVGLPGLFLLTLYTPFITRSPSLSLLSPGLAYGPVMVMGTAFVFELEYNFFQLVVSLVPFFLVNNLLLLNQFPDIEADRKMGRSNYPLLIGKAKSSVIFMVFYLLAYSVILVGVISGLLNAACLIAMLPVFLVIPMLIGVRKNADEPLKMLSYLRMNVVFNLITPTLLAIGLLLR